MTAVYLATAALMVLAIAAVRYQRLSVSVPVIIMVLATVGWNVVRAVRGPDDPEPSLLVAINILLAQVCAVAFYVVCRRLVDGRWLIRAWHWVIAIGFGTLTFIGMLPEVGITDGNQYYDSPVFVAHVVYDFALLGAGVLVLSQRQHDSSRHVRHFVIAAEVMALLVATTQVAVPSLTPLAVAGLGLLMIWATSRTVDWSRSASRAGQLLDSIGVFLFVVDRDGVLHDWNGPAVSLLQLRGVTAAQGLDLSAALGESGQFVDGETVNLDLQGGVLRTSVSVHEVDPLSRDSDRVLMFRPVRSTVETASFPRVSGALKGHDPATQTLGRKAALEQLRQAAAEGTRMLRIDLSPRPEGRSDELMFTLARRMESRSAEENWPPLDWARLGEWSFVAPVSDPSTAPLPFRVQVDDLGLQLAVRSFQPHTDESPAEFIHRVSNDGFVDGSSSAHGG